LCTVITDHLNCYVRKKSTQKLSWAVGGAGGGEDEAGRWIELAARRREEGRKQSGIEEGEGSYAVAGIGGIEWGWWW